MSVRIDISKARNRLSGENFRKAHYNMSNQAMEEMNTKFVPQSPPETKQNRLTNMSFVTADGKSIIWNAKYSSNQFWGFIGATQIKNYTQKSGRMPGKRWDLALMADKEAMARVRKAFKDKI